MTTRENNVAALKSTIATTIRAELGKLQKHRERINDKLAAVEATRNRAPRISAKLDVMLAVVDRVKEDGQNRMKHFLSTPTLDEKQAADLLMPSFGNPTIELRYLMENFLAVFADEIKKQLPEFFRSIAPENQIAETERQEVIIRDQELIEKWEREEEEICIQLESVGAQVDRRPDLTPAIFLELSGRQFNGEKFRALRRRGRAIASEEQELSQGMNAILRAISQLKGEIIEAERNGQGSGALKTALKQQEDRRLELGAQIAAVQRRRTDTANLGNACANFLREKSIVFED